MTDLQAGGRFSPRALIARLVAKGGYGRAVATLMSGTVGAQAIGIVSVLVLARLYTPADFGAFAFVFAVSGFLAVAGTGLFEQAAYLGQNADEAARAVVLALLVLLFSCGLMAAVLSLTGSVWLPLAGQLALPHPVLQIVAAMLATGGVAAMTALSVQRRAFGTVTRARLAQALVAAACGIGLGLAGAGATGLVAAFVLGQAVFVIVVLAGSAPGDAWRASGPRALLASARQHYRFPLFTLPGSLLNNLGANFVAFVTPGSFGTASLGQYNLGQRTAALPVSVVGGAMGDVFRAAISPQHLDRAGVAALFDRTARRLALAGLALCLPLLLAGPQLFELVFGARWREAGQIVQILSPLIFARLVVSPLSAVLLLARRNWLDAALQAMFLVASLIAFWIGWRQGSFLAMIVCIAILQTLIYGVFFMASRQAARTLGR
jgi:O-antigen/teichoic acid export membrane protein